MCAFKCEGRGRVSPTALGRPAPPGADVGWGVERGAVIGRRLGGAVTPTAAVTVDHT